MAEVVILNLSKSYGNTKAVDDMSLTVHDGEFAVFLGPSGSGKTTLLRCVAGLETPDSGKISIDGRDMKGIPARDRNISMVFQNYALFPLMTVRDNIGFPLQVRGVPRAEVEKRVGELTESLGLAGLIEKRPKQLSGGEQQRVAIARALIRETNAILMDEPLSSLDAPLRGQLRLELKALQRDFRRTIVYVTHDQVEAMSLADKVGVMNKGGLLQFDTPMDTYNLPRTSFVARFVGNPPASLLKLKVRVDGDSASLEGEGIHLALPQNLQESVRTRSGIEVIMAVRAEGMSVVKDIGDGVPATVQVVERLGPNTVVDLKAGKFTLRSIADSSFEVSPGNQVWVRFDFSKASFFDPSTDTRFA